MMPRLRLVLAGAFALLGLWYLGRLILAMAGAITVSGSGGIGAVSAGIGEAILEFFPIPLIGAQVALKIADRKGLIGRHIRRWHTISSVVLVVCIIATWWLSPFSHFTILFSMFVLFASWAGLFLAVAVLIGGRPMR